MFDLLDKPLHWIPVRWDSLLPPEKEGELSRMGQHEIELRVEIVDRDEAKRLFPTLFGENGDNAPSGFDVFKQVVHDWRKLSANGQAVPLTDDNIRKLLNVPCFEAGFGVAYVTALAGQSETRSGNSAASPSGGRKAGGKAAKTPLKETASGSE
jgi:hypothetical protein